MFSCGFCEISVNIFFPEHLWATASEWVSAAQKWNFPIGISLVNMKKPAENFLK